MRRVDRFRSAHAFVQATGSYWLGVYPCAARELRSWAASAWSIPDPVLRRHALQALRKRGNMEGAAAFATFVPRARRCAVVRATVAFQAAYNYLDLIAEQPFGNDRFENARLLHRALMAAVDPDEPTIDYYRLYGRGDDGGHLAAMVGACRGALAALPAFELVVAPLRRAAGRVVAFQAHQAQDDQEGGMQAIEGWARRLVDAGAGVHWPEAAGAAGSSLGIHAMIAAAAEPGLTAQCAHALDDAYFPWIGALHSLLDHLVDVDEDARSGQRNLISLYGGEDELAARMGHLAERALADARALPCAYRHELIVAAMAAFYLSAPQARSRGALAANRAVASALSPYLAPALAVFRARSTVARVYYAGRAHGDHYATVQSPAACSL